MNYPDLETCKAISGHFYPPCEHVWVESEDGTFEVKQRRYVQVFGFIQAPTCEELGRWFDNYCNQLPTTFLDECSETHKIALEMFEHGWISDIYKNETQARAEAVKLIVESKE